MHQPKKLTDEEIYELLMNSDLDEDDEEVLIQNVLQNEINQNDISFCNENNIKDIDINDDNELDFSNIITNILLESAPENIEMSTPSEENVTKSNEIQWRKRPVEIEPIAFENTNVLLDEEFISPLSYFQKYWTDELFNDFVFNTNLYAQQKCLTNFKQTNITEIKQLFALHILIGVMKLSRLRLYWSPHLGIEAFKKSMSFNRFSQIRNNLHCVNVMELEKSNTDKFARVRPVINAVRNRCLQLNVEEIVSVDEQIIPFKGRLSVKQYIRGKPNPWGIKVYIMAGKSGQPYDFFLYQGKNTGLATDVLTKFGFGAATVIKLSERLLNKGHTLFCDNFFTSYQLLEYGRAKYLNIAGTVRINRFASPPFITDKQLSKKGRGSSDEIISRDGKVVLVKWMDNKPIHLASNFVGIGREDSARRWNKSQKIYENITRPEIVQLYNSGMGGVDLLDQLISYYRVFLRSRKWPLRVIMHFLDFALVASWLEYRTVADRCKTPKSEVLDLMNFRMEVANCLLYAKCTERRTEVEYSSDVRNTHKTNEKRPLREVQYDKFEHWPFQDNKKEATRCKMNCKTGGKKNPGRTHYYCSKCNVHLCISKERSCFAEYHCKK